MHWFGMFQNLLLYSQTVKWDLNELAHGQGNWNLCVEDALVWDVPQPGIILSEVKMGLE